jgi:hypothetical protein
VEIEDSVHDQLTIHALLHYAAYLLLSEGSDACLEKLTEVTEEMVSLAQQKSIPAANRKFYTGCAWELRDLRDKFLRHNSLQHVLAAMSRFENCPTDFVAEECHPDPALCESPDLLWISTRGLPV